jgi:hypothetical protein
VLLELLAVVGERHHQGLPVEAESLQAREEPTDLLVRGEHALVVAVDEVGAVRRR